MKQQNVATAFNSAQDERHSLPVPGPNMTKTRQ